MFQIDVALRFHGNSSLGYNNVGLTPSDPATRISMVFNPSETTGLMLHSSSGGDGQHSLTLSLQNGSLAFATELGGTKEVELVSTATRVIREGTWYQLFATKYAYTIIFENSVMSFHFSCPGKGAAFNCQSRHSKGVWPTPPLSSLPPHPLPHPSLLMELCISEVHLLSLPAVTRAVSTVLLLMTISFPFLSLT